MIKIKLKEQLDQQDKTVYWLSKQIGVSQNSLGKIVREETTSIKFEILDKICEVLECNVQDIIEHIPNKSKDHKFNIHIPK